MVELDVRLLGRPVVCIGGVPAPPPRGAKAWGLLAYLAAADRPHSRPELAQLLFGEAVDPLGALRWNLAALRRLLGLPDALKGDDLTLCLPADATVDVVEVEHGDPAALERPQLGEELLAGLAFGDSPAFEAWLLAERRRLGHRSASLLREAILGDLASGDHEDAIRRAARLVAMDPLDEGHQALLIRAHALGGDVDAALGQADRCRTLLERELGCEPGAAVVAAAHFASSRSADQEPPRPQVVEARLAVAWQSFLGGAVDHALDLGRAAVAMADRCEDHGVQAFTRTYLGAMLGMSVRGWDEAGTVLRQAVQIAEDLDRPVDAALALGVLAGNDMMRSDYDVARAHARDGLTRSDDPGARSLNLMFLAATAADVGELDEAHDRSLEALSAAERSRDPVRLLYGTAHAARVALMRGDLPAARALSGKAAGLSWSMPTVQPWVLAMQAEVDLGEGDLPAALRHARQAAAVSATTGVAYQQALAARVLGLAAAAEGDLDAAVDHLTEALDHGRRSTGEGYTMHWPLTFILASLAEVTQRTDPESSRRWATALLDHATSIGMHGFAARARTVLDGLPVGSA